MKDIIGKEFMSNCNGPFKVLECISPKVYKIQFNWSKYIGKARIDRILEGVVKDVWRGVNPNILQWSNRYGPFEIIDMDDQSRTVYTNIKIRFTKTGTIKDVPLSCIKSGNIKDSNSKIITHIDTMLLQPNIAEYRINMLLSQVYKSMMSRCYNKSNHKYINYGGIGIRVCDRWKKSMKAFKEDVKTIDGYDKYYRYPTMYQMDKDFKQMNVPKGERIYSPKTCVFLYYMDNVNIRVYEEHNTNGNKFASKYYGVYKTYNNKYFVMISVNGKNKYLGTYTDEIVAANVYNHHSRYYDQNANTKRYEIIPLYNNVPIIPLSECMKYRSYNRNSTTDDNTYDIPF